MKKLALVLILVSFSAYADTAFYKYDYISGLNRICIYDYLGSDVALTIKSYQVCPVTIEV